MVSTKITGITGSHVILAKELGLTPTAEAKSFVVLPGTPAEILAQLVAGRESRAQWGGTEGNLFGTLKRKLESGKGVKVIEDEAAEESNVVNGPWEYAAPEGVVETDEDAEAVMVANADAEAAAELEKAEEPKKAAKAKPEPKRAALPEGYVTPVGLTALINEKGLYRGKREDGKLTSQSMYVYIKNNGEGSKHPFPLEVVNGRPCVKAEAGLQWWAEHLDRVAAKAEAAAARKAEKAQKAAEKAAAAK
jgi:hypothetical protein